jgi:general secretion pathway protein H
MVVLGIVGAVIAIGMPYLSSRNTQTHAILRELSVLSRDLHTRAKLQGAVYRLVIDMGSEAEGDKAQQSFWVEKANGKSVVKADEENLAAEMAKETDPAKKVDPRGFEVDRTILKTNKHLPTGMRFEKVELSRLKVPVTHGRAFIFYMPQGLVDEAAIHLKGETNAAWTVAIHPLTGKAEVISKTLSLKDLNSQ